MTWGRRQKRAHHNLTLAVLTIAGTAYALQQTIVIPALPALQRELHTTTAWVTWLLTAYLLTSSVPTPLVGKLGDQYGMNTVMRTIGGGGQVGAAILAADTIAGTGVP